MRNLVVPEQIIVEIKAKEMDIISNGNIAFRLHFFAKKKILLSDPWGGHDYVMQPLFSNAGKLSLTKSFILDYAQAIRAIGYMDFKDLDNCFSFVELSVMTKEEIEEEIQFLEKWGIEDIYIPILGTQKTLIDKLKDALNHHFDIRKEYQTIRDIWDDESDKIRIYQIYLPT